MRHYTLYNIYSTFAALLLLCLPASSQAQIYLGYCTDNISASATNTNVGATISCAMALTPEQWQEYAFCDFSAIRIGLNEVEKVSQIKVWVREHLRDNDLCSVTLEPSQFAQGWNEVAFDAPISFEGHDTLYLGYDYIQETSKVKVIGASGTKKTPNSYWLGVNGKWRDQSSTYAPACIRAVLTSRYSNAIELTDYRLNRRTVRYYCPDSLTVRGRIRNLGSEPLHAFQLRYEDTDPIHLDFEFPDVPFGQSCDFEFTFLSSPYDVTSDRCFSLHIDSPNGMANENLTNVDGTLYYEIGRTDVCISNPILVEEFTSLDNGYAALGIHNLRESIEAAHRLALGEHYDDEGYCGYNTRYILLSRHQGYGPADALHVTEGSDYQPTWFGEQQLTFAPAVMANRKALPISTTVPVDSIARYLIQGHTDQYIMTIPEETDYDQSSRTLTVKVTCACYSLGQMIDPRVMCVLVQSYNNSYRQKNYFENDELDGIAQQDVVRAYLQPSQQPLLNWTNREEVLAGRIPFTDEGAVWDDYYKAYTIQHTFSCTLTSNLSSLNGVSIVTYVYDAAGNGQVSGAAQRGL